MREAMKCDAEMMSLYEQMDGSRRLRGRMLEALGFVPEETPSRVVMRGPSLSLRGYGDKERDGPVLLIIPAPIKRSYIWDLIPRASVVARCIQSGLRVYMIHWKEPVSGDRGAGLDEYAEGFILECLDSIESETGEQRIFLTGHSLGGTISAIFTALHPERAQGLVLVGAPTHFGPGVGDLDNSAALSMKHPPVCTTGRIPGSFLSLAGYMASPITFGAERRLDWLASGWDFQAIRTHLLVQHWTLDEVPISGRLFHEALNLLYREDRFMRGTLTISGRPALPDRANVPTLSIIESKSRVVTPRAMLPFHNTVRNENKRVLWYGGDTGVALQHVGMLVGRTAHKFLWPEVIAWIHANENAQR